MGDFRFGEKLLQFLTEGFRPMMFLLPRDIGTHAIPSRGTDSQSAVAFLPGKAPPSTYVVHPNAGGLFELPHEIGEAMGGLQADKQVHVIRRPADTVRFAAESSNNAAKVFMELWAQSGRDPWFPIPGGEDEMIVQSEIGRHVRMETERPAGVDPESARLRSLRDRLDRRLEVRRCRRCAPQPPATMLRCLRHREYGRSFGIGKATP